MNSLILETSARTLFHTMLLFSLFLLFAGHNAPGGGFVGGLVAAAAFVLRYVAYGPQDVQRIARVRPESVLGLGLLVATGTGLAALALGGDVLEAGVLAFTLPVLGSVKLSSVLAFDAGVYLVVTGLGLAFISTLGRESPR